MKGWCAVGLVCAALAVQAQEPQQPIFRSGSHAVTVDVGVFDGERAIPGLTAADFDVRDNGVRQTLSGVRPNTLPIDVRLLFDTSGSITPEELERYRRAMARVAEALRPVDRVEILTFSGRISEVVPLQHPPITVITQRQDRDGTSFFDAVSLAMVTRPMLERRQITVVLTDAQDNDSFFDKDTLYDSARHTSAVVYGVLPIGLADDVSQVRDAARDGGPVDGRQPRPIEMGRADGRSAHQNAGRVPPGLRAHLRPGWNSRSRLAQADGDGAAREVRHPRARGILRAIILPDSGTDHSLTAGHRSPRSSSLWRMRPRSVRSQQAPRAAVGFGNEDHE